MSDIASLKAKLEQEITEHERAIAEKRIALKYIVTASPKSTEAVGKSKPRGKRRGVHAPIPDATKEEIRKLRTEGQTLSAIAKAKGLSITSVARIVGKPVPVAPAQVETATA